MGQTSSTMLLVVPLLAFPSVAQEIPGQPLVQGLASNYQSVPTAGESTYLLQGVPADAQQALANDQAAVAQAAVPLDQAAVPLDQALGQAAVPLDQAAVPLDQAAVPLGQAAVSLGQAAVPLGQAAVPLDQAAVPLDQAAVPLDQAAVPFGQAAVPLDQATGLQQQGVPQQAEQDVGLQPMSELQPSLEQGDDPQDAPQAVDIAAAYASQQQQQQQAVPQLVIPELYQVVFETDILVSGVQKPIVMNITTSFAPIGAEQLYKLVLDKYYDNSCFFRVVPDFIVQFGIAFDPAQSAKWSNPILDDPVEVSNEQTTVSFANCGPDSRTTQLFVNIVDNKALDGLGFAPLGQVVEGMDALKAVYNPTPGKPGGVDQIKLEKEGAAWLKVKVPKINCIKRAYISWQGASAETPQQ